jgi:hypothetical protein
MGSANHARIEQSMASLSAAMMAMALFGQARPGSPACSDCGGGRMLTVQRRRQRMKHCTTPLHAAAAAVVGECSRRDCPGAFRTWRIALRSHALRGRRVVLEQAKEAALTAAAAAHRGSNATWTALEQVSTLTNMLCGVACAGLCTQLVDI